MELLFEFSLKVTPGILIIAVTYLLIPKRSVLSKLFLLIFGFVLMRDAMTPIGFWQFGITEGNIWIRFIDDGFILISLALTSMIVTLAIIFLNKHLNKYLMWFGKSKLKSAGIGILGAVIVSVPFLIMYMNSPIDDRGGAVSTSLLVPLLVFALFGNFMEEVLFRGYIQGYFETLVSPWRAVLISGFLFSLGHIFLATTVTDLGWPVILFTLYEGFVCAIVRKNHGIFAATLTHGLSIFILASGLI